MGFMRKISGTQAQIDATRNAAELEAKNAEATARASADALNQSSAAVAQNQRMLAERTKVEAAAREAVSKPLQSADVQLMENPTESTGAAQRRKRATFGRGASSSVSI